MHFRTKDAFSFKKLDSLVAQFMIEESKTEQKQKKVTLHLHLQPLFIYLLTLFNVDHKTLAAYALIKIE